LLSRPKLRINADVTIEIDDPVGVVAPSGDDEHKKITWKIEVTNSGAKLDVLTSDVMLHTADGQEYFLLGYQSVPPNSRRRINLSYEVPANALPAQLVITLGGGSTEVEIG